MKIAFVRSSKRTSTNELFDALAHHLMAQNVRVVGTIQTNSPRPKSHKCDMDVRVLPDGDVIRISQNLGANSKGCHLDPSALEEAVMQTDARLDGADLLILNKFGKHEAQGRGFRDVMARAVMQDIPVLVGVNDLNMADFLNFCGGEATELAQELSQLKEWSTTNKRTQR